jgi:hypothetical protein
MNDTSARAQVPATAGPKDQPGQGGQNQQIQQVCPHAA